MADLHVPVRSAEGTSASHSRRHHALSFRLESARPPGSGTRQGEPVTHGLPCPTGWCTADEQLSLWTTGPAGHQVPLQTTVLERWSDGSVRWVLLDFQGDYGPGAPTAYEVRVETAPAQVSHRTPLRVASTPADIHVDTGAVQFTVRDAALLAHADQAELAGHGRIQVMAADGEELSLADPAVTIEQDGPLRCVVLATGTLRRPGSERRLDLFVRYHFHAGSPLVRVQATVRNPHRAQHPGGVWELGDSGSQLLRDVSFVITPGGRLEEVHYSLEPDAPWREGALPFSVYQESSGGEAWNSPVHVNRDGIVPMQLRGYRFQAGTHVGTGSRATPGVEVRATGGRVGVVHREFWQRFPKAIAVADGTVRLGLLPSEFPDTHEFQGGEQLTEEFVLSFTRDGSAQERLERVRDPLQVVVSPDWYCAAEAMPHLTPAVSDPRVEYLALVNGAVDGPDSFDAKRERIDEYGWRHFGDLYADHETAHHTGPEPFVSHYNNQYDAAAGLAIHFFRTGNRTALRQFGELVRHVIDVDIYHTVEDKPAYNHGLFWHTAHYVQAGRATHRTYTRASGLSGGPSAEHNYTAGLMLYHFMTGDRRARESAIELAQWVIDMDDGRLTPLRWVSRAPTGFASATGSFDYHGPGRGPGNGIVALLNAFRLTGERRFLQKAEELIRRCVHPAQDLEALNLLDTERRWYYTVFLQAIARYLGVKEERGELDENHAYARETLLHYARWMAAHEYPYLDKPELLEFPNETWAAQDLRKSDVFKYAAAYASGEERERFLERAAFFFSYSVRTLTETPKSGFTRPRVLVMTNGYAPAITSAPTVARASLTPDTEFGEPVAFRHQRRAALVRLRAFVAAAAFATAGFVLYKVL